MTTTSNPAPYTDADLATARLVFAGMVEQRDQRFDADDFLELSLESGAESLAHMAMEDYANSTGLELSDAAYVALVQVCDDWLEAGGRCAICGVEVARTELVGGGPQGVCGDDHWRELIARTKAELEADPSGPALLNAPVGTRVRFRPEFGPVGAAGTVFLVDGPRSLDVATGRWLLPLVTAAPGRKGYRLGYAADLWLADPAA